jgi:hypothetical protein
LENRNIEDLFAKESTAGSRLANVGKEVGGAVGKFLGSSGTESVGRALGAVGGAGMDVVGRGLGANTIRFMKDLEKNPIGSKYAGFLKEGADRNGLKGLTAAHLYLYKTEPDYKKQFDESQNGIPQGRPLSEPIPKGRPLTE